MKQTAEFIITGRIGRIDVKNKVTHIDVAANLPQRDGDGWKDFTVWNRLTLFKTQRERAMELSVGDLVTFKGRVGQNSYEQNGTRHFTVDLTVFEFTVERRKGDAGSGRSQTPADDRNDDDGDQIPF